MCVLDSSGIGYGLVAAPCEQGNESSGLIKCRKFLNYYS
jgi:hypothetical protein